MKVGSIVKEEIMRSLPIYFFSFLIIGYLNAEGYISIREVEIFILAFFVMLVHFSFMVWYRKKEQLVDPSISSIISHIFQSKSYEKKTNVICKNEKTTIFMLIKKNISFLLIAMFVYVAYIYASLVYKIDQIFWILVILFIGGVLSKIIYGNREADIKNPMKILYFYIITCVFIFIRYIVLGYSILPVLKGGIILGILLVLFVLGMKWRIANKSR